MLGQCSSLAVLNLGYNRIGAEGAGRLAGVLGQCCAEAPVQTMLALSRGLMV